MANAAGKIVVGASGTVYVAPVGTTAPTNATTALNAAFKELGYVSEDGVTVTPEQSFSPVMAWQTAYKVRTLVTARGLTLEFVLREFNLQSLPFAFGGGTLTFATGEYKYTPPSAEATDPRALVLEFLDGAKKYRLYVPNGQVEDLQGFSVSRGAPAQLPVKYTLNYSGVGDPWNIFTTDLGVGS